MREARQVVAIDVERKRKAEKPGVGWAESGSGLDRKYWAAMALFGVLAVLVWYTMDSGSVLVFGRPADLRLVPLVVIGGLALRTVIARHAEKIRREKDSL